VSGIAPPLELIGLIGLTIGHFSEDAIVLPATTPLGAPGTSDATKGCGDTGARRGHPTDPALHRPEQELVDGNAIATHEQSPVRAKGEDGGREAFI
jgi:hypothetical protein